LFSIEVKYYSTKEIEPWKGFAESLKSKKERQIDIQLFNKILNDCYKYAAVYLA